MLIKIVLGSCLGPHSKFCTVEKLPVISVEDDAYGVAHLVSDQAFNMHHVNS